MSLRKIILKEVDDLDWVRDVPAKLTIDNLTYGYYFMYKVGGQIRKEKYYPTRIIDNRIHYRFDGMGGTDIDHGFDESFFVGSVDEGAYLVYDHNDVDVSKFVDMRDNINESNDFDWAEDVPIDPMFVGSKLETPAGNILTITKIDVRNGTDWVYWSGVEFGSGEHFVGSDKMEFVKSCLTNRDWIPVED